MNPPSLETYEDLKLVLLTPWGSTALVLAIVAALLALALSSWGYRRHPIWPRLLLTLLRALAVGAVLLLVLQPALQLRSVARRPNHVAVLVDLSQSMAVRDRPGVPTRLERARALLSRSRQRLEAWGARRVVSGHAFGRRLRPLPLFDKATAASPLEARDDATRIRAALAGLRRAHQGNDLAGVVLISDGNDNGVFGQGGGAFSEGAQGGGAG